MTGQEPEKRPLFLVVSEDAAEGGGPAEQAADILRGLGDVAACADRRRLAGEMSRRVPSVLLLDARLPAAALQVLRQIHREYPALPIIGFAETIDPETVVSFVKDGAYEFLRVPFDRARLEKVVREAASRHDLLVQVNQLYSVYLRRQGFHELVGISPAMQKVYSIIENVAKTDATLLVTGESGTGKELVARAIHHLSPRTGGRFVPVNCAAIPRELLESELFGHEKGSFTGAYVRRIGCCEQANGGTLFLDEICEMDVALQSKLLRFLQDRSFTRVGGADLIEVDSRVIAATNRAPLDEVGKGNLREDLYYRLNVVPVELPPLRDRPEDVPVLAQSFLETFSEKYNKYFVDFAPEAVELMLRYDWPGNVRELQNTIERIVVLGNSSQVTAELFPAAIAERAATRPLPPIDVEAVTRNLKGPEPVEQESEVLSMEEVERIAIANAVRKCGGDLSLTARKLGISRATLYRKLEKYDIR